MARFSVLRNSPQIGSEILVTAVTVIAWHSFQIVGTFQYELTTRYNLFKLHGRAMRPDCSRLIVSTNDCDVEQTMPTDQSSNRSRRSSDNGRLTASILSRAFWTTKCPPGTRPIKSGRRSEPARHLDTYINAGPARNRMGSDGNPGRAAITPGCRINSGFLLRSSAFLSFLPAMIKRFRRTVSRQT